MKPAAILSFGVSAAFSVINLWGAAFGIVEKLLNALFGVLLEYGKVTLFYKSMTVKVNMIVKGTCIFVYIILLCFSIFFSMSFISNNENAGNNREALEEKKVQSQAEKISNDDRTLARLNQEEESIRNTYQNSINTKQAVLNQTPLEEAGTRRKLTDGLDKLTNEMNTKLSSKQAEITQAETLKQSHLDESKTVVKKAETHGFTYMIELIAHSLGLSKRKAVFIFFLILSTAFDLTSSLLWFFAEHERENKVIVIDTKRPIGFSNKPLSLPVGISNELLESYVNFAWGNSGERGDLPGYERIAAEIDVKPSTAQKIHRYLLDSGHVKIEGKKTYLINEKDDIINS